MKQNLLTSHWSLVTGNCANQQSGRSMVEMLGVIAIGAVMTLGAIAAFNVARRSVLHTAALDQMSEIVTNTRILYRGIGNYNGINVEQLQADGAIEKMPLPNADMTAEAADGGKTFALHFDHLTGGDCEWLTSVKIDWAAEVAGDCQTGTVTITAK